MASDSAVGVDRTTLVRSRLRSDLYNSRISSICNNRCIFQIIFAAPVLIVAAILLFAGTFLTAIPLHLIYVALSVLKCFPPASQMFKVLDYAAKFAGVFGFGNWKQILGDARDARMELEVEEQQNEAEKSEKIATSKLLIFVALPHFHCC